MDYIHSRAISATATEGWIFTFPHHAPKAALRLCTLCILPPISSPLDWVQCSLRFFPTDKVRTILCKFALFVHPKLCSVKQSKQSKFKTCCILNLNRTKNYAFLCANYAAVSFWSMAELMMRSFRIQKSLSLFSVEHHYLPTRNLKTILALNCVKFSAVWEKFFASCAERRGATIGALRGQSRVHFLCVARWMFTFSHSIYRQKLHKNFSRWIFANF